MTPYSQEYTLKNGLTLIVRQPVAADAEALIALLNQADRDTRFLMREPGEFDVTPEREREMIEDLLTSESSRWFVAILGGELVGQCGVHVQGRRMRVRHRGGMGIVVRGDRWGLGIGGRLMREAIKWCHLKGLEQLELEYIEGNERARAMYMSFGFEEVGRMPNAIKYADGTYAATVNMVLRL